VRADVGEIIDADSKAYGHLTKRVAHDGLVPAKGPRAAGPMAGENDMHGPARADRALELATPAPEVAAVLRSNELGVNVGGEERPLHLRNCT